jgi:transcriptional regulator with XRE-family HTH domain
MPTITDRVRERMVELGWTKSDGSPNSYELRDRSGVGYATAHGIVTGTTKQPDIETVQKLARALRAPVDWLLGEEQDLDMRAYEKGREDVARVVRDALDRVLTSPPADAHGLASAKASRTGKGKPRPARAKAGE